MMRKLGIPLTALILVYGSLTWSEQLFGQEKQEEVKPRTDRYGDPLPPHALARFGTVRFRQAGMKWQHLLYNPDGKTLATIGSDHGVIIWDAESGQRLRSVGKHTARIVCAALSRDGKSLASADDNGNLLVSEMTTGKTLQTLKGTRNPCCIALSPGAKFLATAGINGWFEVWNLETGKLVHKGTEWPEQHMNGAEFTFDGKLLALCSTGDHVLLLNTDDWTVSKRLSNGGYCFQFSPDARHYVALAGNSMTWWDVKADKLIHEFKQESEFHGVAIHPNGKIAATGSAFGYFQVWDLETGKLLKKSSTPQKYVVSLAFSPDGKKLVTGSFSSMETWDTTKWDRLTHFDAPTQPANLIRFADEGKQLVALHIDQPHYQVRRWDVASAKEINFVEPHDYRQLWNTLSNDGRWIVGTRPENILKNEEPTIIRAWDSRSGEQRLTLEVPKYMSDITFARDNNHLMVRSGHDRFMFWDLGTGKLLRSFSTSDNEVAPKDIRERRPRLETFVYGPALSSRADWLALAEGESSDSTSISIWDTATGRREQVFSPMKADLHSREAMSFYRFLAFFPVGRSLAEGVTRGKTSWIEIWEPYTGKSRRRLAEVPEFLATMAISPSGKQIASGYPSGEIRIWDVAAGKQLALLEGHRGQINSLAFSPDGRTLASASADATILLWQTPTPPKIGDPPGETTLGKWWDDMADSNAKTAYGAIHNLAKHPAQSLPFLEKKLRSNKALYPEGVRQLLADLDNDDFQVREQASQALAGAGKQVRLAVIEALKAARSPEVKRRCEELLENMVKNEMQPEQVRSQRLAETLQIIGSPEALKLLKRFFAG
jgi:WD40 repeat protein